MKHLLSIILSILLLTACGESKRNSQLLERAETIMNDSCDVALSMLQDSINPKTLTTERGRAIYAVLLSQALDKNYIDLTSDSIIAPAVEFFADVTIDDDSQSVHYAMLSNYYLGKIYLNNISLSKSLIHLLKAEQYALHINDHLYLGFIYSALAYTNNLGHNPSEDLKYTQLAYNHFKETGIKTYSNYALRDLAIAQNNCHKLNESQHSFNMLLNDSSIHNDSLFLISILPQYAKLQRNQSNFDSMKHTILSLDSLGYKYTATEYALLATAYINENNLSTAKNTLDNANKAISINDSIAILNALIKLNLKNNDYKSAYNNLNSIINAQIKTNYSIWEQSLMGVHRDFVNERAKISTLKLNAQKQTYIYLSISLALGIIVLVLIYQLIIRRKNANIENYIIAAQEINNLLSIKKQECSSLLDLHARLFNNQIKLFHNICDAYYETPIDSTISKNKVYESAKSAINKLSFNGKELHEFENFINSHLDNIMIDSRNCLSNLKEKDFNLLLYIYSGFSAKAIALFTHDKISNVYNRKARLKIKIEALNSPLKENFLKFF